FDRFGREKFSKIMHQIFHNTLKFFYKRHGIKRFENNKFIKISEVLYSLEKRGKREYYEIYYSISIDFSFKMFNSVLEQAFRENRVMFQIILGCMESVGINYLKPFLLKNLVNHKKYQIKFEF